MTVNYIFVDNDYMALIPSVYRTYSNTNTHAHIIHHSEVLGVQSPHIGTNQSINQDLSPCDGRSSHYVGSDRALEYANTNMTLYYLKLSLHLSLDPPLGRLPSIMPV